MPTKYSVAALIIMFIFISNCSSPDVNQIINDAVKNSGWNSFKNNDIEFDFRGTHYKIFHKDGRYIYEKIFVDTTQGIIREGMTNDSTYKELNGLSILLEDSQIKKIRSSINQVVYFNLLPYKLNDGAVVKKYAGESIINGKDYYKVKVSFDEDGGGDDYNDWFMYWFEKESKSMDYFAYYFHTNGGSSRFRSVKKQHNINGFIFYDWENFTSDEIGEEIGKYDQLYSNKKVRKVSDIELKNIEVQVLETKQ